VSVKVRKSAPSATGGGEVKADSAEVGTLEDAMGGLNIAQGARAAPLKGVPLSEGVHTRFDGEGGATDSPGAANGPATAGGKTVLRGVAPPAGTKVVFDD